MHTIHHRLQFCKLASPAYIENLQLVQIVMTIMIVNVFSLNNKNKNI